MSNPSKTIGILLFDGVEELDAVGPWEVLAYWTRTAPNCDYRVVCLSQDGEPVTGAKGLAIGAHHSFEQCPQLDIFIHPGGQGTRTLMLDAGHLEWVRQLRSNVGILASVCTGSLVFAAAGLLSGRPATTHWASIELLGELDPSIEVRPDDRWVDDGDIVTSAGISAGIDMSLHLVDRLAGREVAKSVRRGIQYDPLPPI